MVKFKLGELMITVKNGQAHHEFIVPQLFRAPNRYLGGHGFNAHRNKL